jgi:hypothetical protein
VYITAENVHLAVRGLVFQNAAIYRRGYKTRKPTAIKTSNELLLVVNFTYSALRFAAVFNLIFWKEFSICIRRSGTSFLADAVF